MNVLVVSPHPDDEAIGCAGAIRQHVIEGGTVWTLFLTSGEAGFASAEQREHEAGLASQVLGTSRLIFARQPDGELAATPENVERLARTIRDFGATLVYAPHEADNHPDHAAAHAMVRAALLLTEPFTLYGYEVWTPIANPNVVIDITAHIGAKVAAIRAHASQVERNRFDEAAWHLARYRAEMQGRPGGPFAEAFRSEVAP